MTTSATKRHSSVHRANAADVANKFTEQELTALLKFIRDLRAHYGSRLHDIVSFGSRARGDHRPDSDADLAIVLDDAAWTFWQEKWYLADLADDALIDDGLYIQSWPVAQSEWENPDRHHNPRFVKAIRHNALSLAILS